MGINEVNLGPGQYSRNPLSRELRVHVLLDPESNCFSLILGTFCVHDQIKDQDFSYLLVTLRKKVNIKLFLVVFSHIVLFRFEAKYKPDLQKKKL